ncbi:MAG: hypothetical protein WKG07_24445 [Hymenobacter sp.]
MTAEAAETIQVSLRQGQKKTLTHDKQPYERMADHIGRYPAVLISPYDTDLIRAGQRGAPQVLRQPDGAARPRVPGAAHHLQRPAAPAQRRAQANAATVASHGFDRDCTCWRLTSSSRPWASSSPLSAPPSWPSSPPIFQRHYQQLADGRETVALSYKSQLLGSRLCPAAARSNERQRLRLAAQHHRLAHRDDFVFLMDDLPVKSHAFAGPAEVFRHCPQAGSV